MYGLIKKVSCIVLFLSVFAISTKSSVSQINYKIVFGVPDDIVISEKERIVNLYRDLSYGMDKASMWEIVMLRLDEFKGEYGEGVEMHGDTLILFLDKNGKMFIKGSFSDACEREIVKKSWILGLLE